MTPQYINARIKAEKIYLMIFGAPKSHSEWAESFNIVASITRELLS